MPQFVKAALFYGGAGSGVFVAKDEKTGEWSEPAFFTMGAAKFRLSIRRAGFGSHPARADRARSGLAPVRQLQIRRRRIGRRRTGRSGSLRRHHPQSQRDLLSFGVRAKGLFCGNLITGRSPHQSRRVEQDYYGKPVTPTDIVIRREVKNPHSDVLRTEILKALEGK
ncbi:MAG: hypothetical protein U0361_14465 [Nitrospiraceae bacterium]